MRIAMLFAIAALLGAGNAAAQQFYKWKDADGVTHYTATPPPSGQQADKVAVNAAPASLAAPSAAGTDAADPNTPPEARSASAAEQRSAACTTARANLNTLETNPFVSMDKDGDGKPELLSVDEQNAQIARAREQVRSLCSAPAAAG